MHKQEDFAFETTLSGRSYLRLIQRLQNKGWHVELIYLALPSVELSKQRVAERVAHGGHDIPLADIERRFPRSLRNLLIEFSGLANTCLCYMNVGRKPELIFEQRGIERNVVHDEFYHLMLRDAGI